MHCVPLCLILCLQVSTSAQVFLERKLLAINKKSGADEGPSGLNAELREAPPNLGGVELACRRLLTKLADDEPRWADAVQSGIPFAIKNGSPWYNFRQLHFSRKKKDNVTYLQYGGLENLYTHGKAGGWRAMLERLEAGKMATRSAGDKGVKMRLSRTLEGEEFMRKLHLSAEVHQAYKQLPDDDARQQQLYPPNPPSQH